MVFEVRAARADEPVVAALIERLQAWYVELYGAPDVDPLDPTDFAPPRGAFLLGVEDGVPVALGGFALQQEEGRTVARLRRVFVVPEHQRSGLAGIVLDRLEAAARDAGAAAAVLSTGAPQTAAVALYRSRGYVDVPPSGHYGGWTGAVHLAKPLA